MKNCPICGAEIENEIRICPICDYVFEDVAVKEAELPKIEPQKEEPPKAEPPKAEPKQAEPSKEDSGKRKPEKTKSIVAVAAGGVCVGLFIGLLAGGKAEPQSASNTDTAISAVSAEASEDKNEHENEVDREYKDTYEITFIMSFRNEFRSVLEKSVIDNCPSNVKLTTMDAQNDPAKQQQMIESARNAGNDAIIVDLIDPDSAASMLESAGDTPVIFVSRYPSDDSILDPDSCVYVGSDDWSAGRLQGEFLVDYFNEKGQKDITYVMVQGTLGKTSTTNRTASVIKALEDGGLDITLEGSELSGENDRATAIEVFAPLISNGEADFDCVICNNDYMALGVIETMEMKNLNPEEIPIVGIDATADGRQAIKDGKLAMSVFWDAYGEGLGAIRAAVNMIEGNALNEGTDFEIDTYNPAVLWVPYEAVTPDNVADYDDR